MAALKATIEGQKGIQRKLKRLKKKLGPRAFAAGAYAASVDVMRKAKRDTPVLSGDLQASGYVTLPETKVRGFVVEMGFGGKAEDYASFVHERTEIHHVKGKAKFLEGAMQAKRNTSLRTIGRVGRKALASGSKRPRRAAGIPVDPFGAFS